jgi:transposase
MNMTTLSPSFAGVDVAGAHLDIALHPQGSYFRVTNDETGLDDCLKRLAVFTITAVVMEATGGLERLAAQRLSQAGLTVHVINPRRIANWRRVVARHAKTDRIDALLIAEFAATIPLEPARAATRQQMTLRDLAARREQIVRTKAATKKQQLRATEPAVQASLKRQLAFCTDELQEIEAEMEDICKADNTLLRQCELLESIKGVGRISALLILAELPEIAYLPPKKLASLVGVAPHPDHSGKKTAKARIQGGRTRIRSKCYILAHNAIRFNPGLREYAERLKQRGKSRREIVIACINKLLHLAHAILQRGTPWKPEPPKKIA